MTPPTRNRIEGSNGIVKTTYSMPNWIVHDLAFKQKYSKGQFAKICKAVQANRIVTDEVAVKLRYLSSGVIICLKGNDLPKVKALIQLTANAYRSCSKSASY